MKKTIYLSFLYFGISSSIFSQTTICGYAVNIEDSTAIEGTTIFLYDQYNLPLLEDIRTATDSTGYYELKNIETGKYSVNAWTYFYFQADTHAYIFQPGIFNIDSDSTAFETPCFYVNFYFKLEISDSLLEKSIENHKKSFLNFRKRIHGEKDTLDFNSSEWTSIDWAMMAFKSLIYSRVETIDSLFTPAYSSYIRRKDW